MNSKKYARKEKKRNKKLEEINGIFEQLLIDESDLKYTKNK